MSGSLTIDPAAHRIAITSDARTTLTTDGTLICAVPVAVSIAGHALTLPDFQKDIAYFHTWFVDYYSDSSLNSHYDWHETCAVQITAVPQEYSDKTILADAPVGADFFSGLVRLSRTSGPASTWMSRAVACLPVQGQWIPFMGGVSIPLEVDIGMVRGLHVYLDKASFLADGVTANPTLNKLVIEAQQSVTTALGGYGSTGQSAVLGQRDGFGIEITQGSVKGLPIFNRAGGKTYDTGDAGYAAVLSKYAINGTNPCAKTDPTSYTSIYSIDLQGQFGRRS